MRNTVANWGKRCVYLTHQRTVSALESYLNRRIARDMGTELTAERYRGLARQSCLVLAGKGRKFVMNTKRRTNEAGEQVDDSASDSHPTSQSSKGTRGYAVDHPGRDAVRLPAASLRKGTTSKRCSSF